MTAFLKLLESLHKEPAGPLRGFFGGGDSIAVARAPGRLDVMGGIADYSGSLVLQLPLSEGTLVAAQMVSTDDWQIASLPGDDSSPLRRVELSGDDVRSLLAGGYDAARQWFHGDPASAWAAYVAGVVLVLARERSVGCQRGLRILVRSSVPEGKGVSSSAALEVATLRAVCRVLQVEIDGAEAARLCQLAENLVVGAPCGIMDQMTSALGRADQLLALLCQPADVQGFVALPESVRVWGIDSGIRHAVSGSDYSSVRTGAFMGYRILAELAGLRAEQPDQQGVVRIDDPLWHGYLANLRPDDFEKNYAARLPERIAGSGFLRQYGGTPDGVTRVEPDREYAVRQPTAHPIHEHARVCRFRQLLAEEPNDAVLAEMGELMYASHTSYSACRLGSEGTDRLVEMVREAGSAEGLFGGKITGGGSGGTVAVLGRPDAHSTVAAIAERYRRETGRQTYVFAGSSAGAYECDVHVLNRDGTPLREGPSSA